MWASSAATTRHCEIEDNTIVGTRPDREARVRSRLGYAIQADYHAWADVDDNALSGNARATGEFADGTVSAPLTASSA